MRSTRTYVNLDVPPEFHAYVKERLLAAGYDQAIMGDTIDMHGLALIAQEKPLEATLQAGGRGDGGCTLSGNCDCIGQCKQGRGGNGATPPQRPVTEWPGDEEREVLGKLVRLEWMDWAREHPQPKPSWLTPWEELTEPEREVDRRIGERIAFTVRRAAALSQQLASGVFGWYRPRFGEAADQEPEFRTTTPPIGHGWIPLYTGAPEQAAQVREIPFDTEVQDILGRPNFSLIWLANKLRRGGASIEPRSEAEQAYCLHWMLSLYLKHGSAWRDAGEAAINAMQQTEAAPTGPQDKSGAGT